MNIELYNSKKVRLLYNYLNISTLNFTSFWKRNQYINSGDKVFAIISRDPGKLIGKIKVAAIGSGKNQTGQKVNIKVAGYPYLEFGLLQARTKSISLVSNNDYYSVEVNFPKGIYSTLHKKMKFLGEMSGSAEIITENLSLMERFFIPLKSLTKKFFE